MMRIFLVRHAETLHNAKPGVELSEDEYYRITEKGEAQCRAIGQMLADQPIVAAYTSETERTLKSLRLTGLAKRNGIRIRQDSAFNRPASGIKEDGTSLTFGERIQIWREGSDPRPKEGESLSDAVRRAFIRLREEDHAFGKAVIVVSHGDIIAGIAGCADGAPPWKRWDAYPNETGSIQVIDMMKDGPAFLRALNIVPELDQ